MDNQGAGIFMVLYSQQTKSPLQLVLRIMGQILSLLWVPDYGGNSPNPPMQEVQEMSRHSKSLVNNMLLQGLFNP